MPKSAKGAHGGGVEYDIVKHDEEFEIREQGYVKNKDEPGEKTEPKIHSQYNEEFVGRLDRALRKQGLMK